MFALSKTRIVTFGIVVGVIEFTGGAAQADPLPTETVVEDTLVVDALLDPGLMVAAHPGLGAGVRVGRHDRRLMLGLMLQAGRLADMTTGTFFDASVDTDALTVDWGYDLHFDVRGELWRFGPGRVLGGGALFTRASVGYETWRVAYQGSVAEVANNFVSLAAGVTWFPLADVPIFVEPEVVGIYLFGQESRYALGSETVKLNSLAWTPLFRLGYRFE